jgi:hypothetical protein
MVADLTVRSAAGSRSTLLELMTTIVGGELVYERGGE